VGALGDLKDIAILGGLGVAFYFVSRFLSNPIGAAREYPPVATTSGLVSGAALVDNVLREIGAALERLPQAAPGGESAPYGGWNVGQE
jgi:hypothetical protein